MSINSEINRITGNIAAAYVAAAEKGATMPQQPNSENLAGTILSIPVYVEPEPGATVAVIGNQEYSTVSDALAAAVNGDTVTMVADSVETECVSIPDGITLDLNGYGLTSDYVYGGGHLVDDSEGNTGTLTIKHARLSKNNRQLPVRYSDGVYKFCEILKRNQATQNNGRKYVFQLFFEPEFHAKLAEGSAACGVDVRVYYTDRPELMCCYTQADSETAGFVNSYNPDTGKYGKMHSLSITGAAEEGVTYSFSGVAVSELGPELPQATN